MNQRGQVGVNYRICWHYPGTKVCAAHDYRKEKRKEPRTEDTHYARPHTRRRQVPTAALMRNPPHTLQK